MGPGDLIGFRKPIISVLWSEKGAFGSFVFTSIYKYGGILVTYITGYWQVDLLNLFGIDWMI